MRSGCRSYTSSKARRLFGIARRITRGTQHWIDIVKHPDGNAAAETLHAAGYEIYLASMNAPTTLQDLSKKERVAVVFGNEHRGVSDALAAGADGTFAIPMRGFVESLNVSVAAAITLFTLRADRPGDLSEEQRELLTARFLMHSVRDAGRVVEKHVLRRGTS